MAWKPRPSEHQACNFYCVVLIILALQNPFTQAAPATTLKGYTKWKQSPDMQRIYMIYLYTLSESVKSSLLSPGICKLDYLWVRNLLFHVLFTFLYAYKGKWHIFAASQQ